MKILISLLFLLSFSTFADETKVDNILVEKSARKLYLRQGEQVTKEYHIALGSNPPDTKKVMAIPRRGHILFPTAILKAPIISQPQR